MWKIEGYGTTTHMHTWIVANVNEAIMSWTPLTKRDGLCNPEQGIQEAANLEEEA